MDKIVLFFSDLRGTYLESVVEDNRMANLSEFVDKLEQLCAQHDADSLVFSFITDSDSSKILLTAMNELLPYFDNKNINFGMSFYSDGQVFLENNQPIIHQDANYKNIKAKKIYNYIDTLKKNGNDVVMSYYADDVILNHMFMSHFKKVGNNFEHEVVSIIPNHTNANINNLDYDNCITSSQPSVIGLNECLDRILVKKHIR